MDGGQSGASSPQPASPARAAVDVIAVTTRDDFLLELGATLGGQASVNPVDSVALALEPLRGARRPQVLMIDSRDVENVAAEIESVRSQAPSTSIVVFANEERQAALAERLRDSSVIAVLSLPVHETETKSIFDEAVTTARARLSAQPAPAPEPLIELAPQSIPAAAPDASTTTEPPVQSGGRNYTMSMVLGGVALLIIAGGLIAYLTKRAPAPSTAATLEQPVDADAVAQVALPAVETSLVKGKVDELLEKARLAMRERHYAEPAGDNALLYYRSAAASDATSAEARDGLARVASVLGGRFEEAVNAGQLDEAATALAQFKNAIPEAPQVPAFQQRLTNAQISKSISDGNLDRAGALVRAAQQGTLLPPAQITRWRSELSRLQEELRQKRASDLAARDAAAAEQKKAREARAAATAEVERQAQVAREKAREEEAKAAQAAQALRVAPAPSEKTDSGGPSPLQSSLKRKRYVSPEYPSEALADKVGGVVQVSFTVDVHGTPTHVRVIGSEPKGVFDVAALTAVKRWRYEPLIVDGTAIEVPVRLQIRFAPQE